MGSNPSADGPTPEPPAPETGATGRAIPDAGTEQRPAIPVKIVIAGGFGVGKTTTVTSISEIPPVSTEAPMTDLSIDIDPATSVPGKARTTVALDFGRITVDEEVTLYLFGTPGQDRFGFMWDDIVSGALGALVIVDTRRLDECYGAVDYFEQVGMPFVVALNLFDGHVTHELDDVRWALAINDETPVVTFDARDRLSVRDTLLAVLGRGLAQARAAVPQ